MTDRRRDWRVVRRDAAGERHVVAGELTEAEARLLATSYAARGQQHYWIEPADEAAASYR